MTYVALLRGINVGGSRRIDMSRLKAVFESLGFDAVRTYINSGNVIFRTRARDEKRLTRRIEKAIEEEFGHPVAVVLRSREQLDRLVSKIRPDWVNDRGMRTDVWFLWPSFDRRTILRELPIDPKIEDVVYLPGAVVWRIDAKNAAKSRRTKVVGTDLYRGVSIRNVNTVRKLAQLMAEA